MNSPEVVSVKVDLRDFDGWISFAIGKQVPFATAKALSRLAVLARDEVRSELPGRFHLRSTWLTRGIQAVPANKSDYPAAFAVVGSRDQFMELQETGGTKTPKTGRDLALPSETVRTGAGGKIPLALRPRRALERRGIFKQTLTHGPSAGSIAILRRVGKDRYPLQVLYLFRRSANVQARFGFRPTVQRVVSAAWGVTFRQALYQAMQPRGVRR
jgi:hypothetical protein